MVADALKLWLRNGYTLVTERSCVDCGMPPNFGYGMVTCWLRKGPVSIAECLQTLVAEWLHFGYGRVPSRLRNASKLWLRNGYTLVTEDFGSRGKLKPWTCCSAWGGRWRDGGNPAAQADCGCDCGCATGSGCEAAGLPP